MEKISSWLSNLSTKKAWVVGSISTLTITICIWLIGVTFILSSGVCNENLVCVIFGGSFLFPYVICFGFVIWISCLRNQNNGYQKHRQCDESLIEEDQEVFFQQAYEIS